MFQRNSYGLRRLIGMMWRKEYVPDGFREMVGGKIKEMWKMEEDREREKQREQEEREEEAWRMETAKEI